MNEENLVMYRAEFQAIEACLQRCVAQARAKAVLLVDRNGQFIAHQGDVAWLDTTAFSALCAGNLAAAQGMARLCGEAAFASITHEGEKHSLHLLEICRRAIIVAIFDASTTLGLVRLRLQQASGELGAIVERMALQAKEHATHLPFGEITDDELDNLFAD